MDLKMSAPTVSILLASYNGEKYIDSAISSILNQTYTNFELLIGLNNTTDSTLKKISKFNDDRIKVFNYKEKGKSKTLNKLLKEAKGKWIGLQDDDDIWLPNKLELQLETISKISDITVVGTQIIYIDEEGRTPTKHGYGPKLSLSDGQIKQLTRRRINQMANTSTLSKKEAVESVEGWRENIEGVEDMDMWLRLMNKEYKFINLKEKLVMHRIHGESNFNSNKCEQNLDKIS